jgi:hypothetical protein
MKKFIALGGVVAMGAFGLIGLGSTVATAAPKTGPTAKQQVCTSATNQLTAFAPTAAFDSATLNNEISADNTANAAEVSAETAYITAAMTVINDVDAGATQAQINFDTANFNTSVTNVVNAAVAAGNADLVVFNGSKVVKADNLKNKVLGDFKAAAC